MQKLTATLVAAGFITLINATGNTAQAQTLSGSAAAMQQQHQHALSHGYTFASTSNDVTRLINSGELVRVGAGRHLVLHNVSYPYVRPEVKTFIERLSAQYHNACGEKLVVTSMTRPMARQPVNSHDLSVHPTGMAVDLRIPAKASCRTWLERTLLTLEGRGVLNVIRERRPPHYHLAIFPEPYTHYLASMTGQDREYVVRRGDTLSTIASRENTSIAQLRNVNGLRGDLIRVGQKLQIPGSTGAVVASGSTRSPAPARREVTHRVQAGETLWRIATRYSTSVDVLRSENGLAGDMLQIGQVLRIMVEES